MARDNIIQVNEKEFREAVESLQNMADAVDDKWLKSTMRRKAKPIVKDMQRRSHSARLLPMISITTARKWTNGGTLRVGVVKNDTGVFKKISAQGLAAILEYGTEERFRRVKKAGITTGRVSTGKIEVGKGQKLQPYLRPAWDNNKRDMVRETEKSIIKKIEKEAKK